MFDKEQTVEVAENQAITDDPNQKLKRNVRKILRHTLMGVLCLMIVVLLLNAVLCVVVPKYYPTFGKYRLFPIMTENMESDKADSIPSGSLIVSTVPTMADDIKVGDIVTYRITTDNKTRLYTKRVVDISRNDDGSLTFQVRAENAALDDVDIITFNSIVGVYSGKSHAFWGTVVFFLQSAQGVIFLIIELIICVIAWTAVIHIDVQKRRGELIRTALARSEKELSNVSLRYDNICEITAVMDVLSMVAVTPKNTAEQREVDKRLAQFVDAKTLTLPQTPETAAVLDTLPAPDTPVTLAAALRSGATLRQADDGQTLILTGMSGGKSILLTPVQTPDGIILCQQGVRLRSNLAPDIESLGAMSMPEYPEFFEGKPVERMIDYPELPEPHSSMFGPEMIGCKPDEKQVDESSALSAPTPVGRGKLVQLGNSGNNIEEELMQLAEGTNVAAVENAVKELDGGKSNALPLGKNNNPMQNKSNADTEVTAELKIRQENSVNVLEPQCDKSQSLPLNDGKPGSSVENVTEQEQSVKAKRSKSSTTAKQSQVGDEEVKNGDSSTVKKSSQKRQVKPLSEEEKAARKERLERIKADKERRLAQMSDEEREQYLAEQERIKARAAEARRKKRDKNEADNPNKD